MSKTLSPPHEHYPDPHHEVYSKTIFGFWLYLLTEFALFATLFATFAVLRNNLFAGPPYSQLFHLPQTLLQTVVLLTCSFTAGLGGVFAHRKHKTGTLALFILTFILGACFLWMQLAEFSELIASGNSWQRSGSLSAFFTLSGTLSLHVVFALFFTLVLLYPVFQKGVQPVSIKRLTCLRMFWQFINVIWIFIFTIVYLMGVLA